MYLRGFGDTTAALPAVLPVPPGPTDTLAAGVYLVDPRNVVPISDAQAATVCDSFTCASPGRITPGNELNVTIKSGSGVAAQTIGIVPAAILQQFHFTADSSGQIRLNQAQTVALLSAMAQTGPSEVTQFSVSSVPWYAWAAGGVLALMLLKGGK